MSASYHLHCKTCDKTCMEYEQISGTNILSAIYKLRQRIIDLLEADNSGYLELHAVGSGCIDGIYGFLHAHRDHEIDITDMYGDYFPVETGGG